MEWRGSPRSRRLPATSLSRFRDGGIIGTQAERTNSKRQRTRFTSSLSAGAGDRRWQASANSRRILGVLCQERLLGTPEAHCDPALRGRHPQAHVHGHSGVGERAYRDEVHTSFTVGTDVFQSNPAGAFEWKAAFQARAALYSTLHIFDRHVVQQDHFGAMLQCLFQLFQRTHFDLNRLFPAAIEMSTL